MWRAGFGGNDKVLLTFQAALPLLALGCSRTWALFPPIPLPGLHLRLSLRVLLDLSILFSVLGESSGVHGLAGTLSGRLLRVLSWDPGGKVTEDFG